MFNGSFLFFALDWLTTIGQHQFNHFLLNRSQMGDCGGWSFII